MDETSPITPPQVQTNRMVPSSRSSTAGSDNGDIPVTFNTNRLGNLASQDSYERGTIHNGVAMPAFQDSYGNSRQLSESTGREDPWVRPALYQLLAGLAVFCSCDMLLLGALVTLLWCRHGQ